MSFSVKLGQNRHFFKLSLVSMVTAVNGKVVTHKPKGYHLMEHFKASSDTTTWFTTHKVLPPIVYQVSPVSPRGGALTEGFK